ncbi:MAG: flagellar hook-length control protein FliK [Alphaproteobacteria bacterium]|nr:flagellar hook-length control protein FliK [Alphaproteobacteria bacterium]
MSLQILQSTVAQNPAAAATARAVKPAGLGVMNFFDLLLGKSNAVQIALAQGNTPGVLANNPGANQATAAEKSILPFATDIANIAEIPLEPGESLSVEAHAFLTSLLEALQREMQKMQSDNPLVDNHEKISQNEQFVKVINRLMNDPQGTTLAELEALVQAILASQPSPEIATLIETQWADIKHTFETDLVSPSTQNKGPAYSLLTERKILPERALSDYSLDTDIEESAQSFSDLLKDLLGEQPADSKIGKNFLSKMKAVSDHTQPTPAMNADKILPSLRAADTGFDLFAQIPALLNTEELLSFEGQRLSMSGMGAYATLPSSVNIMTHAPAAGAPHPGTALIAAVLRKLPGGVEARSFNVQLDPPELGRVEIRLDFSRNKAMKVHLIAEKSETYLMLQRDAQILERALQESGMSLENESSLSFSFAGDGQDFSQNGRHDSQGPMAREQDTEEDGIVINSTMTWQIDLETGHVHYDLWV